MIAPHIVVVGGGITGLTAAWKLTQAHLARDPASRQLQPTVSVLEADYRVGGKIQTTPFAGLPVDTGPDAFLARHQAGMALCHELGLIESLVSPAQQSAYIFSRKTLRHFPPKSILGVPSSLGSLVQSRVLSPMGALRAAADLVIPPSDSTTDRTVAAAMGDRLGTEAVDRLIDPLIGGINGGSSTNLSIVAAARQLNDLLGKRRSVIRAAADTMKLRGDSRAPMFYAPPEGMEQLVHELVDNLGERHVDIRTGVTVRRLEQRPSGGWNLVLSDGLTAKADAVILATPAYVTARLLSDIAPRAADALSDIKYSSVAMIRLAYAGDASRRPLDGSGYVVPAVDGHLLSACSWASSKWTRLGATGQIVFRASAGRWGDHRADQLSDTELIDQAHNEIDKAVGLRYQPREADVTRWSTSFPQYEVGHHELVVTAEQALATVPTLRFAGAAYHGLGIPSCIEDGSNAAQKVLAALAIGQTASR